MPGIGILSSIDYNTDMQTAFGAGYVTVGALPNTFVADKAGYQSAKLRTALHTLLNNPQVTLIVTFGGLIAYNVAQAYSTMTFISLVGGRPSINPPLGYFAGCCDLESYTGDAARVAVLTNPANGGHFPGGSAFQAADIGLLYDSQSAMAQDELATWGTLNTGAAVDATNGVANPSNFGLDFNQFPQNIQAVVVSADPYFHRYRNQLVAAANASNKYICYPLLSYRNHSGTRPAAGLACIVGPDLVGNVAAGAYYQMGVMAANIINNVALTSVVNVIQPTAPVYL
jgi:hypothetical protein